MTTQLISIFISLCFIVIFCELSWLRLRDIKDLLKDIKELLKQLNNK